MEQPMVTGQDVMTELYLDVEEFSTTMGAWEVMAKSDVYAVNVYNGWYDKDRRFGEEMALLHSEVSEALEAYRDYGAHWQGAEKPEEGMVSLGEKYNEGWEPDETWKPLGVGSELADILVRLLDTAKRYDVDLTEEFVRKMKYNRTRGRRHGGKRL